MLKNARQSRHAARSADRSAEGGGVMGVKIAQQALGARHRLGGVNGIGVKVQLLPKPVCQRVHRFCQKVSV